MGVQHNGSAGQYLVLAHLKSLQYDAGLIEGADTDVIACINGVWRTFQVKSRDGNKFSGNAAGNTKTRKPLSSYNVDAFAFCCMTRLSVYYVHKRAVCDYMTIPESLFARQGRDMSFEDLLRRWDAPPEKNEPLLLTLIKNDNLLRPS